MHAHLHIESILPHSQVWIDREMHGQCAACRCGVVSVVSLLEVSSCLVLSRLQSSAWPRRHDLLQVLCCWPPSYLYPCFVLYTVWLRRSACCLVPVDASGGTQVLTVGNKANQPSKRQYETKAHRLRKSAVFGILDAGNWESSLASFTGDRSGFPPHLCHHPAVGRRGDKERMER